MRKKDRIFNKLQHVRAILSTTTEAMHAPCGSREHEDVLFAAYDILDEAIHLFEEWKFPGNKLARKYLDEDDD